MRGQPVLSSALIYIDLFINKRITKLCGCACTDGSTWLGPGCVSHCGSLQDGQREGLGGQIPLQGELEICPGGAEKS